MSWLYAATDIETKLILDVQLYGRHGTGPAVAFLAGFREKHDLSKTVFLVDQFRCRVALSRVGLNSQVDYTNRNLIEEWSHTLMMQIDVSPLVSGHSGMCPRITSTGRCHPSLVKTHTSVV
ncbi:IS6 family transposase [Halorubrum sp. GN11GM_10-3_MGM]|nr:IS6 family transposase [Halorubrum sp. GN11GM_10-3_MGM]